MARASGASPAVATATARIAGLTTGRLRAANGSERLASHSSVAACSSVACSASPTAPTPR